MVVTSNENTMIKMLVIGIIRVVTEVMTVVTVAVIEEVLLVSGKFWIVRVSQEVMIEIAWQPTASVAALIEIVLVSVKIMVVLVVLVHNYLLDAHLRDKVKG